MALPLEATTWAFATSPVTDFSRTPSGWFSRMVLGASKMQKTKRLCTLSAGGGLPKDFLAGSTGMLSINAQRPFTISILRASCDRF